MGGDPISLSDLETMMHKGRPVEDLVDKIHWKDFERIVSEIFSTNGFRTLSNLRFTSQKKRYEVDIVALERPYMVVIDCKHWGLRIGKGSALKTASQLQLIRTKELVKKLQELPQMEVEGWEKIKATPMLVTLHEERISENEGVLIVPIFRLNSFIEEMRSSYFGSITSNIVSLNSWVSKRGKDLIH